MSDETTTTPEAEVVVTPEVETAVETEMVEEKEEAAA